MSPAMAAGEEIDGGAHVAADGVGGGDRSQI